jgi:hypothetical protein
LAALEGRLNAVLANAELKLDTYSRAHLQESAAVAHKVTDARISMNTP